MHDVVFALVTYSSTYSYEWPKISIPSLRKHFPDNPIVVIDHNDNEEERAFLEQHNVEIIRGERGASHGKGIDVAVTWCREHNKQFMMHLEPDCLVYGRSWFEQLWYGIGKGNWMAGLFQHAYGPIHPCPSLWVVDRIPGTFEITPKDKDVFHPKYSTFLNTKKLVQQLYEDFQGRSESECHKALYDQPLTDAFKWLYTWDVGLKNWFECAIKNKAYLSKAKDFTHFWMGSCREPHGVLHAKSDQYIGRVL